MANLRTRVEKLEEVHTDSRRGAVATYERGVAFNDSTFTMGDVTGLTYAQVIEQGYETVAFMPTKKDRL